MNRPSDEPGRPELSIVVPVYNEEPVIAELDKRLRATLSSLGMTWEAIFVDDGSTDRSLQLLTALAAEERGYRIIALSRNFGHQIAITAGLDHASGDAVVVMDADLQDPPEVVAEMVARWREGFDVVYGVRLAREAETIFKRASAALFYRLTRRVAGIDIPVDTGDFRLMGRNVVLALRGLRETHRFVRGLVVWVGFKQTAVRYKREGRYAGSTKYPLTKMVRFAVDGITSFSVVPLRVSSYLGVASGVVALALAGWALYTKFYVRGVVQGWTSMLIVISLVAALQFFMIGVLGEYVGRIYEEVKRRPLYVIRERTNLPQGVRDASRQGDRHLEATPGSAQGGAAGANAQAGDQLA